jgi:hypothetical protein
MLTANLGEESSIVSTSPSRLWIWLAVALIVYSVLRLTLLPADGAVCGGIGHDGAYLSIVADQVRTGHGFVNPAHWLLLLNPKNLPMPYHNANPGYPGAMSVVAALTRMSVVRAGFAISALSNSLLSFAVFALVLYYTARWQPAALAALVTATFPAVWTDSLSLVPDALCTALCVAAIAIAVKHRGWAGAVFAGAVLGAAWEVRSSATLVLLPLAFWMFRTRPRRQTVQSTLLFCVGFVVVISPWLIHTQRVWGSPFRSDAGIYLMQNYLARPFGGDVDRFWRSLDTPLGMGEVLRREPVEFATFYVKRLPYFGYILLAALSGWNKSLAACYVLLTVAAGWTLRRRLGGPELQAGAMLILLTLAVLAMRADTFELRYLGPALVLWILFIVAALYQRLSEVRVRRSTLALAGIGAVSALMIAWQDLSSFRVLAGISPDLVARRDAYLEVAEQLPPDARVIVSLPYFYTLYTGRTSLSPPYAPEPKVLAFMSKYSVRYVALPTAKLNYYYIYPDVRREFAPELHELKTIGPLTLFEVQP